MSTPDTPAQFIAKWSRVDLPERAASQEHFIDLCRLLGQPTPAEHDATGAEYAFERGVRPTGPASAGSAGQYGYADVWWRGKFAWEYKRKGKYKTLDEAYRQLCQYREALENPPLLIVSDIARTEIHTNFTGTRKEVHAVGLHELDQPEHLDKLRRVFTAPESFKPERTTAKVTETAAAAFAELAQRLRSRGHDPHDAAHFLMKCMFCLFAEDVGLLPQRLFTKLLERSKDDAPRLTGRLSELFDRMRTGGDFGTEQIGWFNGGLFDESPALDLDRDEISAMLWAASEDWGAVEPAIFGTLFERSLDPSKRAQIGAHYTSREDIMLIVEPVVMAPLRREWEAVRVRCEKLIPKIPRRPTVGKRGRRLRESPALRKLETTLEDFLQRLASIQILDPACGSGNFLYVAIQQILDLEKQVVTYAARPEIGLGLFPNVRPTQLHGIEINPYAAELAQVVIWIGYLQWMRDNGFRVPSTPILEPLQTIECRDAILEWEDESGEPLPTWRDGARCRGPASWPEADFIIGNPPFLGSKLFREHGLPDDYIRGMYESYDLPNTSDLCCYWLELGRRTIERKPEVRAGLLATQGIRGGDNRRTLERVKQSGDIFMAWSDREWILEGAAVHVSIAAFSGVPEESRVLDGVPATEIRADLTTAAADLTSAQTLAENSDLAFMGVTPSGKFEVSLQSVCDWVATPNPSGESNRRVLRPWVNGSDLTKRRRGAWIIDFGCAVDVQVAASFVAPFEHVREHVAPKRASYRTGKRAYWCFERPRPEMRGALDGCSRFIATPLVSKHRVFTWLLGADLCANLVIAIAREDDYFFGVLHSSIHELWARRKGTQLREAESGSRYTPTTCFETFPLPWPPGSEPPDHPAHKRIADAARELNAQRERWLNPPEWIEPLATEIDARDDFADVPAEAWPLIRHSAIMAAAVKDPRLKRRTLTNLYNERPTWLRLAHERLDRAVLAAYAAVDSAGEWSEDWAEVWTDTGAGQPLPDEHALAERRKETDQRVLANLLRMNLERAEAGSAQD